VVNAFTVDVEEWFHVCGVAALAEPQWDTLPSRVEPTTRLLLDLCDEARVRATFFVVGWVAERYPRLIQEIAAAGHAIGSHSQRHRRVYELDRERFSEDLRASVRAIEDAGGGRVACFRAPEWSINDRSLWALDVLVSQGIAVDASMAPVKVVGDVRYPRRPHVRNTDAGSLLEAPPFVVDRFGQAMPLGWGWALRMSAPVTVLRAIERANHAGAPAVLTVHPWEIDPDPPRVALPPALRFAHYFRLGGFRERLRQILCGGAFGTLDAMLTCCASSLPSSRC
jgi:polysaccharide deacetylase family protein (PEP-CTERM system associated)